MVLLDNIIILAVAVIFAAVLSVLTQRTPKKWIFSTLTVITELGTVIFLLFSGADIEELFLMLLIFGAVSVSAAYYIKPAKEKASENETGEAGSNGI